MNCASDMNPSAPLWSGMKTTGQPDASEPLTPWLIARGVNVSTAFSTLSGCRYMSIIAARVPLRVSARRSKGAFEAPPKRPGKPIPLAFRAAAAIFRSHAVASFPASSSALRAPWTGGSPKGTIWEVTTTASHMSVKGDYSLQGSEGRRPGA